MSTSAAERLLRAVARGNSTRILLAGATGLHGKAFDDVAAELARQGLLTIQGGRYLRGERLVVHKRGERIIGVGAVTVHQEDCDMPTEVEKLQTELETVKAQLAAATKLNRDRASELNAAAFAIIAYIRKAGNAIDWARAWKRAAVCNRKDRNAEIKGRREEGQRSYSVIHSQAEDIEHLQFRLGVLTEQLPPVAGEHQGANQAMREMAWRGFENAIALVKYNAHICMEPGCLKTGAIPCFVEMYEEKPDSYYCPSHAAKNGFCRCCGQFWAGIDSFDFRHPGWCDNCWDQTQSDVDVDDDDSDFGFDGDYYAGNLYETEGTR